MKLTILLTAIIALFTPSIATQAKIVPLSGNPPLIELTPENTVVLREAINSYTANKIIQEVYKLAWTRSLYKETPIYLVIDSPGGSIDAGRDIIEALKVVENLHTITIFGASMAHAIAQALPGTRYVIGSSEMMAHRARGRVGGQFEDGELESRLEHYKKIVREMEQTNADRMQISLKEYKQKVINEWWEAGSGLIDNHFADEMISLKCSKELVEQVEKIVVRSLFGDAKFNFSKCPLLRAPLI